MPIQQVWYRYDLFPYPTLVSVVQSWAEMIQPVFNVVFWGRVKKEVFVMSSTIVHLRALTVTSIFLNIFFQDCRIDLVCVTFFSADPTMSVMWVVIYFSIDQTSLQKQIIN